MWGRQIENYGSKLQARKCILDRKDLHISNILGTGHFGDVFKGYYNRNESTDKSVAIKACKEGTSKDTMNKFLEEAEIMCKFRHDHIIKVIGVVPDDPVWIVMELAKHGELSTYLRQNKHSTLDYLLIYTYQLSTALYYLERNKFVHRDVAARNVLVCTPECVKLADFGLSRFIGEENLYYKETVGKLPIKWMSPESINYRIFTTASDVWMFGVCMWEILSVGEQPFSGIRNDNVIVKIENGERLPKPSLCPERLYKLMLECWSHDPKYRPRLAETVEILRQMLFQERIKARVSLELKQKHPPMRDTPPPKPPRSRKVSTYPAPIREDTTDRCELNTPKYYDRTCSPIMENSENLYDILRKQKTESDEDSKWLEEMENTLNVPKYYGRTCSPIKETSENLDDIMNKQKKSDDDSKCLEVREKRLNAPKYYGYTTYSLIKENPENMDNIMKQKTKSYEDSKWLEESEKKVNAPKYYRPTSCFTIKQNPENMDDIMKKQKTQSDEDSKWLEEMEKNFKI